MGQERRSFGSIERRSGYFRARYVGPDWQRYEAPNLFSDRIDAEFWLGEVHRSISRQEWRPPVKVKGQSDDLDTLAGYARHCLAERELTPRAREECGRLLEKLIAPTLGSFKLKYLEPDQIRRWYSTVLSSDRPVQRKRAYSLLRSILREAEDEGLIDRIRAASATPAGCAGRATSSQRRLPNSTSCWICRPSRGCRWCSPAGVD